MQAILGRQTSRHLNIRVPVKPEGEIASEDSATFSSSVFILNRNVCWKAVQLGSHLSQSQIVSKLLFGEDSLLYWSFVGSKTPYYHEISPPALVGAVVGSKSPQGSSIITDDVVVYAPSGNRTSAPDDLQLCGQAVGYGDPFGAPQSLGRSSDTQQHRIAKVDTSSLLFVNWRSLGRYAKGLEHLRVAVSVDASAKRGSAAKVLFETEPRRGDFHSCRMFKQTSEERDSFQIVDLSQLHPKLNSNFHSHRNGARDENLAQKLKARRFRSSILPFEASLLPGVVDTSNPSVLFAQQVRKGTRGVVITGSGKHAHNVIMTTLLLRETGCKLPVEFLYMKGQVHEVELQWISSFNITTVDFAPLMKGFSEGWGREEWRLGAAKVFSILASSFEEVLFLDPDNYVLRDPTYLFETQTYRKHGSIFWPDFPVRKKGLAVWDILEMQGRFWKELEFETGQIVINKRASWRGLMMTVHISKESNFYFRHFLGDKEAFFWGYASSQTPYYLAPTIFIPSVS
ncbi:mannosyltransferase putative-domain-containing protein [Zopfochytrium polystomum]|nr:mannosyltransferase putative-domain-containing protein [Zopfochytrium polystomum]